MRKKKFKVGDKVLITKSRRNFVEPMEEWVGQIATITKLRSETSEGHTTFDIDLDGGKWAWVFEHGHFVSIDEDKKKVRNVLKLGDKVTFKLIDKDTFEYEVRGDFMNTSTYNGIIFDELGMSKEEKMKFCDKAYGYEADRTGQWPECKEKDYKALTRLVTMLHQECNIYNKRVMDLREKI